MTRTLRRASPEDADSIASIHVDAWREAYRGLVPDELLDTLSESSRSMKWHQKIGDPPPRSEIFVAETDGELVGFVSCGPCRDEDLRQLDVGEIYALYVDPNRWRRGTGSDLLRRAVRYFDHGEFECMALWVLEDNEAAQTFYEKAGFVPDHTCETDTHRGFEVEKKRYRAILS